MYALSQVSDERSGERLQAVVAQCPGTKPGLATLQRHRCKQPVGIKLTKGLRQGEALPRNPSGSAIKCVLREQFAAGTG